jgi:FKBP-type peptidyl-prolyl cis-trans isomerase
MRRIALLTVFLAACGGETPQTEADAGSDPQAQAAAQNEPAGSEMAVNEPADGPATDPREVAWASELAVDLDAMEKQASGLYIQVLAEGDGPPAASGDQMGVHYTVWLSDGSKLDSSFDHAPPAPLPMVLNETPLIDGWTEGVTGMRLGEKRRLVVPFELAYGAAGRQGVPPFSALLFEVELAEHEPAGQ